MIFTSHIKIAPMKKLICLFSILGLALLACNSSENPKPEATETDDPGMHFDQVFTFMETSDKTFCDSNMIVPTDCGGGQMYLTKNGNVLYTTFCMGSDTNTYSIGKYKVTGNDVKCSFDKSYSYFNGYNGDEVEKPYDPNSGKLIGCKPWTIEMKKLDCKSYDYGFFHDDSPFSVSKSLDRFCKSFKKEIAAVKVLEGM